MIRALPVLVLVWLMAGFGAVAGSMLGNGVAGTPGLFGGAFVGGAFVGGAILTTAAVFLATKLGWIPRPLRGGALLGALMGFFVATPIAVLNLHTPLIPVGVTALAGVGALLGGGFAQGRQSRGS